MEKKRRCTYHKFFGEFISCGDTEFTDPQAHLNKTVYESYFVTYFSLKTIIGMLKFSF